MMKIVQLTGEKEVSSEEEKSMVNDAENGNDKRAMVMVEEGGYKQENPPHDDCCPICFGPFHVPCRTSCGHWFCSSCIVLYWDHTAYFKQCKCPICGSLIIKLLPHATVLVQPTREEHEILKQVERYNHLNVGGLRSVFWEAFAIPSWTFVRRRYRETSDYKLLEPWRRIIRFVEWELVFLYMAFGFTFIPYGYLGIVVLMEFINLALGSFFIWDASRCKQELERSERLLEVADVETNLNE